MSKKQMSPRISQTQVCFLLHLFDYEGGQRLTDQQGRERQEEKYSQMPCSADKRSVSSKCLAAAHRLQLLVLCTCGKQSHAFSKIDGKFLFTRPRLR